MHNECTKAASRNQGNILKQIEIGSQPEWHKGDTTIMYKSKSNKICNCNLYVYKAIRVQKKVCQGSIARTWNKVSCAERVVASV